MGIINLQEDNSLIRELTNRRVVESLPFAGRYRLIDFALSSMVNSGVQNVGVMLPDKPRSVLDHLRSGKDWDLARRHDGLFYLPAPHDEESRRRGDLRNFYYNLDFFEHSSQKYVLLAGGSFVYNINFNELLRFHQNTNADITMVYYTASHEAAGRSTVIETAENGLVEDIAEKPAIYDGSKVSMNVFLMEKRIFVEMIRYSYEHGGQDLLLDGIIRRSDEYSIYAYEHDGYVAHVDSTASYYKDTAVVKNSLIANGCIIRGEVENSILFRGVTIEKGVKVKNSIIMQKCDVQENSLLENVICDKNVVITKEKWLKGAQNYPLIVAKNVVI